MARRRFGIEERKTIPPKGRQLNWREKEIQSLRKEIKILSRQFRNAAEGENNGIKDLTSGLRVTQRSPVSHPLQNIRRSNSQPGRKRRRW